VAHFQLLKAVVFFLLQRYRLHVVPILLSKPAQYGSAFSSELLMKLLTICYLRNQLNWQWPQLIRANVGLSAEFGQCIGLE
jgi:hypothetical protein